MMPVVEAPENICGAQKESGADAGTLNSLARNRLAVYGHRVHGIVPAAHHKEWIAPLQAIERGELKRLLILAPPGGAKSTWVSLTFAPWYLGNHPGHSLMFFTSSDNMARRFGTTVKGILEENEQHRLIFPDVGCRPDPKRGWSSDTGMYLEDTPRSGKDPAYVAMGYGTRSIGSRANGIIMDDVLDQEQSNSDSIMTMAKDYYDLTVEPRLKGETQQTWVVAIMTSWNEKDMAHFLAQKADFQG